MCKLFMMAGINDDNRSDASDLIIEMAGIIGLSMRDGIGYAAVTTDGDLFGERWFKSEDAFDLREEPTVSKDEQYILDQYKSALTLIDKPKKYNTFGDEKKSIAELWGNVSAVTLHGRFATSAKEFRNTHPFIVNDTSLVHNGVIRNAFSLNRMKQSSCDSEVILNLYDEMLVSETPANIQAVVDELIGYYACGVFSRDSEGNRVLDIFKDQTANLSAAYIDELGVVVFVTNIDDLKRACDVLDLTIGSVYKVNSGILMRLNPVDGSVITMKHFNTSEGKGISAWDRRVINDVDADGFAVDLDKVLGL